MLSAGRRPHERERRGLASFLSRGLLRARADGADTLTHVRRPHCARVCVTAEVPASASLATHSRVHFAVEARKINQAAGQRSSRVSQIRCQLSSGDHAASIETKAPGHPLRAVTRKGGRGGRGPEASSRGHGASFTCPVDPQLWPSRENTLRNKLIFHESWI